MSKKQPLTYAIEPSNEQKIRNFVDQGHAAMTHKSLVYRALKNPGIAKRRGFIC